MRASARGEDRHSRGDGNPASRATLGFPRGRRTPHERAVPTGGRPRDAKTRRRVPWSDGVRSSPPQATFTLKLPAYFTGSLPSHVTPSISFEVRISSFGTFTPAAAAACL